MSIVLEDLERAKQIQSDSLEHDLPEDARIQISVLYLPHDIVGGDFYAVRRINPDEYGFLVADVMGHGVAAALYTMHLSALWERNCHLLTNPVDFAKSVNRDLAKVVKDESFATAICGVVDVRQKTLRFSGAGGQPALVIHTTGVVEELESAGCPFGMMDDAPYMEVAAKLTPDDRLLLFTDGAVEVYNADREMLGVEGLIQILKKLGYPAHDLDIDLVEEELLRFSNAIQLEDDVTFLEIRV